MSKNYAISEKRPSKMFLRAMNGGGSSQATCHCGRTHYAPRNLEDSEDENDYPSWLKTCEDEQKEDPEGIVIEYNDDFIYSKMLSGILFVVDCPCNGLRRYEDFFWNNRDSVRDYYKIRVEQEAKWAEAEVIKNKLAGII